MLDVLRAELEREFDTSSIQRLGTQYLGMHADALSAKTPAEAAARLVEQCALLDSLEALADIVAVERPATAKRLAPIRREGFRPPESVGAGSKVGRFTLYAVLGVGPDSTVFRARDGERVVRLRLMRECTPRHRYRVNRHLAATRMAGEVSDPRLPIGVYAGPAGDRTVVVHDFFDGDPISIRPPDLLRLKDAWPILRRVLGALAALHSKGLVHGAVHGDNILLGRGAEPPPVLLLDAGAHSLRSGNFAGGVRLGRVNPVAAAWAAPEQLLGEPPTARSDVYSAGLLLYVLMAGRLPIPADAPNLVEKRLGGDLDPLGFLAPHGSVPDELEEVMLRIMDSDPQHRPPDASAVLELLSSVVSSAVATPSTTPEVDTDAELERLLEDPTNEARAAVLEAAIEHGAGPKRVADAFVLAADQIDGDPEHREASRRLLVRAGAIYENLAGDPKSAERAYRKVIELTGGDEGVWTALERIYRRSGEYEKLVELLIERRDSLTNHAERARVFLRLARVLYRDLSDEAQAIVALTEAVAEDPSDDTYAHELEALAQSDRAAWRSVLESLTASAANVTEPDRRCRLFVRLGHWHEREVGRADLALRCFQTAVKADPANEEALERIAAIYRRAHHWTELSQALLARASVTASPALARDLRAEAAGVLIDEEKTTSVAREILEQVLTEDPSHREAGRQLCRLLLAEGKPREWAETMERRATRAAGNERRDLLAELARGYADKLGDLDQAIMSWELVLTEKPADLEALRALEDAYSKAGRPAKAVAVMEQQLAIALTPRQRVSLLERIAKLCEHDLLDDAAAAAALERILDVDADHEAAHMVLCAVYARLRRWNSLALALERRAEHARNPGDRIESLLDLGRVAKTELADPARALRAYEAVLAIDPSHRLALDAAAVIRTDLGDFASAADALDQIAEHAPDALSRAEAWLKAAEARRAHNDADAALERYRKALDAQPGHAAAASQMAFTLVEEGEVGSAVAALEHALPRAESGHARAEIGASLARILLEQQQDAGRAAAAVTVAHDHDPTNAMAHFVMGELARRSKEHERAATHYERAALHLDRFPAAEQVRILGGQVEALLAAGRKDDARRRFGVLVERFADRRDALELAARLSLSLETPERSLGLIEKLLVAHGDALPIPELARVLTRKGEALRLAGRTDDAVAALERATVVDRSDVAALSALMDLHRDAGNKSALTQVIERILERASADEQGDLLVKLGDAAAELLSDTDLAARAYLKVLAVRPEDRRTLLRLVRLYSDTEDWQRLVEVVLKLAGLSSDRIEKARYVQMAARLSEKELDNPRQAVELYDLAMTLDPDSDENVSRALALHSRLGDTATVRQVLEQQIARASASKDRERAYRLATALADLDLGELQIDDAIVVNEAALQLVTQDLARENVLLDLYMTDAKQYLHRAARLLRRAIERDPRRPEPYRRLRQFGVAASRLDTAFCACQSLTVLKHASSDEEAFFNEHRGGTLIPQSAKLSESGLGLLIHPDANPTLTSLLVQIHPVVASKSRGVSLAELGLDESDALDPANCEGTLVQAFLRASEVLRTPMPLLFEQKDQKVAVMLGQGSRPHVLLSPAGAHKPFSERKAAFIAASSTVLLRPGYLLRVLLTQAELKAWVLGAVRLVAPKFSVAREMEEAVSATQKQLERYLPRALQKRVADLLDSLLEAGGQADLTRWVAGVDLTADRAGFLFCNDLGTALGVIRASGDGALSLGAQARSDAMLGYAISSEYLRLRNALSLSIDRTEPEALDASDIETLA